MTSPSLLPIAGHSALWCESVAVSDKTSALLEVGRQTLRLRSHCRLNLCLYISSFSPPASCFTFVFID